MAFTFNLSNRFFWLFVALTSAVTLLGGSSRTDVVNGLVVQCLCLAAITGALIRNSCRIGLPRNSLSWLLFGFCGLILLQLFPLPFGLWSALPGRGLFAEINDAAGLGAVWRPMSVVPDNTLNALLAMIVPVAALVLFPLIKREEWPLFGLVILALILLGCALGLVQIASGSQSFYLFNSDNDPTPNGFFANRNHQALFLALIPPLVAAVTPFYRTQKKTRTVVELAAAGAILIGGATVLVSGSRIGFLAFVFSTAASLLMWWWMPQEDRAGPKLASLPRWARHKAVLWGAVVLLIFVLILLIRLSSDLAAVERFGASSLSDDGRIALIQPLIDVAKIYSPVGTGFGTFAQIYQIHEPADGLTLAYLNHAHNEAIEILIEGGAAAGLLATTFLIITAWRTIRLWMPGRQAVTRRLLFGRAGSIMVIVLLIGCITDYPLRTPALGFLFVIALTWLWLGSQTDEAV